MFRQPDHEISFSSEHAQVLESVEIGVETGPGTILHDFDALLAYIREIEVRVTGRYQLPLRALEEINARLARPIEHGLKRPVQKSFPHIHGLYLLVRASGLTLIDEAGRKPFLSVDDELFEAWGRLNAAERYGNLLESWFLRGSPDIIGERHRGWGWHPENFTESLSFFFRVSDEGMQIAGDAEAEDWLKYWPGWHNLGLLDLFGLIDIERADPEPGEGWRIERILRTRFGEALFALLQTEFFGDFDNIMELAEQEQIPVGVLQPILQPYFPAWRNKLTMPGWQFREGVHIFKVSLGRIWRRIAVPARNYMDSLAAMILKSVRFDQDHLYQFSYQNRFGAQEYVHHSFMDEGPWTSEMLIGDVPLHIGQTMTFLFDFGDNWEFDVTLERVEPDADVAKPVILESHGEPPQQYPSWDDEAW
jgi:hypothetical protein